MPSEQSGRTACKPAPSSLRSSPRVMTRPIRTPGWATDGRPRRRDHITRPCITITRACALDARPRYTGWPPCDAGERAWNAVPGPCGTITRPCDATPRPCTFVTRPCDASMIVKARITLAMRSQLLVQNDLRDLQRRHGEMLALCQRQETLLRQLTPRLQEAADHLRAQIPPRPAGGRILPLEPVAPAKKANALKGEKPKSHGVKKRGQDRD